MFVNIMKNDCVKANTHIWNGMLNDYKMPADTKTKVSKIMDWGSHILKNFDALIRSNVLAYQFSGNTS